MIPNSHQLQSENIGELMAALAKAQGKIQPASKDKSNPFFKSKYADLASVWDACREELSKNGLAIVQTPCLKPEGLVLITTLGHSSGQWIKSEMPVIVAKQDPQTLGSALTYYRRYCLSAIVGVAPNDDDDAEKAQTPYRSQSHQTAKPQPQKSAPPITQAQVEELELILEECDSAYRKWVYDTMQKNYNTNKIAELNLESYNLLKAKSLVAMNDHFDKQKAALAAKGPSVFSEVA